MVIEIQEEIRSIFLKQNNITENIIFLEEMTETEFNVAPQISILPDSATIESAWHWENKYSAENGKKYKVQRKYNVDQPMVIRMVFEDKRELDKVTNQFLLDLPKQVLINTVALEVEPQEIDRIFAKGSLDVSIAIIKILVKYPILEYREQTIIPSIDIDIKK